MLLITQVTVMKQICFIKRATPLNINRVFERLFEKGFLSHHKDISVKKKTPTQLKSISSVCDCVWCLKPLM